MLWFRLVFVLVAKVDCILLMKRRGWCCILVVGHLLPELISELISDCKCLLPAGFIFQQDGAPAQTARRARDWLNCQLPWFHWEGRMVPKLSGFEQNGLSSVESYARDIPQSATRANTIREVKWRSHLSWYGKICLWNPSTMPSKTLQRDSEHVCVLVLDKLNISCEAQSSLFENNYLRCDLIKSLFVAYMFLDHQKTGGGLTKSDITFVIFEIFW